MFRKYELRTIDSWPSPEGGWHWNNSCVIERGIILHDDATTPRKLFAFMRRNGWLNDWSKGRVALVDQWPFLEVTLRSTGQQIYCLIADEVWEADHSANPEDER